MNNKERKTETKVIPSKKRVPKAGSPLGGKMSRRKNFWQSNWLIEWSPRKSVEPRIVGIRSTFRGSTFFRLVEIRLKAGNQGDIDSVSILHEVSSEDTIR